MCIVTDYIGKYPLRTKQILGISYNQLRSATRLRRTLTVSSILRHRELENLKENQKIRINAAGGGRPQKLSLEEQIVLCLFYLRQMPSFEILGMLFGISKTIANDTFHYWRKIIRDILPASLLEGVYIFVYV